ncbi:MULTISPECIES: hypothetical protein [unclassified Mesorhizobium]|uniref:deoxynucleotide monophosphate kinase family protein n=1 Tax=unclassified Mesorhizobium TaxID=325217 RepID=UPI000FCABA2A|nr:MULTISPECIES: hypothetical protein [unclassified Mesorhizobium]RUT86784.1 hypothetical protein EOD15_24590 [Mesorhizobium sp. M7A.T.Ca.US.000.02.2.1]RUT87629.1 hypothetical protein EOD14_09530 [Mesorhizobium sp. M7A.T.Ca.US.000.02.1.1]
MIIGLYSPAPQSGKSEVARELVRYGFVRKGFADALKAMIRPLLATFGYAEGVIERMLYGDKKEAVIPETGHSTRSLMQTLGTEWGRQVVHRDLWVRAVLNDRRPDMLVIDDVRFPSEYDAIRDEGGQVWKVLRPGQQPTNGHPSEGLLDDREFDEVIVNDGSLSALGEKVRNALTGPF